MRAVDRRRPPPQDDLERTGRIGAQGQELLALDEAALEALAGQLANYQAVAIGFIHAYVNPDHERRA